MRLTQKKGLVLYVCSSLLLLAAPHLAAVPLRIVDGHSEAILIAGPGSRELRLVSPCNRNTCKG